MEIYEYVLNEWPLTCLKLNYRDNHSSLNTGFCGGNYGSSSFIVVPVPLSWQNASSNCQVMGGHLATIESQAENNIIHDAAASKFDMHIKNILGVY